MGQFLTVEGTEGVGKSTNMAFIEAQLRAAGIDLVVTREPGGTPLAEQLRGILLENREEPFAPMAELLTVFAARAQHIEQVIKPALLAGKWVLSDRFTDATFAYQGYGRGLSLSVISQLENMVQNNFKPDTTFLLDIDVAVGLERACARGELDRFEHEQITFFEKVRSGYLERVKQNPARFCVVDAGQPLDAVQQDIHAQLTALLCTLPHAKKGQ